MDNERLIESGPKRSFELEKPSAASVKKLKSHHSSGPEKNHPVYNITINTQAAVVGDGSHAIVQCATNELSSCSLGQPPADRHLDEETRHNAGLLCGEVSAPVQPEKSIVPVKLQMAKETVQVEDELDQEGHYRRRKDFLKLYDQPPGDISDTEMFDLPKQQAQEDSVKKYKTEDMRKEYVDKTGNIIGVVGNPGIGKTTSLKKWVGQILEGKLLANVSFLFFILIRNIDFSQKMTLLQFLLCTIIPDWEHSPESDKKWLRKIFHDRNVFVALDGLDESGVTNLKIKAPTVNLFEPANPLHILLNLIGSKLLPRARILITSRPNQLLHLHVDHKPKFIVQILGLDEIGQDILGRQICTNWDEHIKKILLQNPDTFAYCFVPVNFILTVDYLMASGYDVNFVCMTQVLASACKRYALSPHLRNKLCELDKLSKLAWNGYQQLQFMFEVDDLNDANLCENTHQSFLSTSILKSESIHMAIMDGQKRSYFSHLIWQEYFVAMHLMLFADQKEFEESLQHLFNDQWEVVTKFLFGLCNFKVYKLLKSVAPACSKREWQEKKSKLKNAVTSHMAKQYSHQQVTAKVSDSEDFAKILNICSWVHEVNDENITQDVAGVLPDVITMTGTILPSDISNLFYVIRAAARNSFIMDVDNCNFARDTMREFWKEVADSKIKIQRCVLERQKFCDDDIPCIIESLQHVEELILLGCGVSPNLFRALSKKLEKSKPQIRTLNLSNFFKIDELQNQIGDEGLFCFINCLQNVRGLELYDCDISSAGVKTLAEELLENGHKLENLVLGGNSLIGDEGARFLIPCLHLIEKVELSACDVTEAVQEEIISELRRLCLPEDRVVFGHDVSYEEYEENFEEFNDEMGVQNDEGCESSE